MNYKKFPDQINTLKKYLIKVNAAFSKKEFRIIKYDGMGTRRPKLLSQFFTRASFKLKRTRV